MTHIDAAFSIKDNKTRYLLQTHHTLIESIRKITQGELDNSFCLDSELDGRRLKLPAGGALTDAESDLDVSKKADLIAANLLSGSMVIARAHGTADRRRLQNLNIFQQTSDGNGVFTVDVPFEPRAISDLEWNYLLNDPLFSSSIDQDSNAQCAALGTGHGHPGLKKTLFHVDLLVKQVILATALKKERKNSVDKLNILDLENAQHFIEEKMQQGDFDIGIELPGGLIIRSGSVIAGWEKMSKHNSKVTWVMKGVSIPNRIEVDTPLLVKLGRISTRDDEKDRKIKNAMYLDCVDERVGVDQQLAQSNVINIPGQVLRFTRDMKKDATIVPGDYLSHQTAAIGLFDIQFENNRILSVASHTLRFNNSYLINAPTSGCLRYLGPIADLSDIERQHLIENILTLFRYIKWAVLPYQDYKGIPFPLITSIGTLTAEEKELFKKKDISVIELSIN